MAPTAEGLSGYLSIQLMVFSGVADTTPDATIDTVRLYVNGDPNPIELQLDVYKDSNGSLYAPYPYTGSLQAFSIPVDHLMANGAVGDGWVNFHIEATDPLGSGVGEVNFSVDLSPVNEDVLPQWIQASQGLMDVGFDDYDNDTNPSVIRVTGPSDLLSSGFQVQTFDGPRQVIKWNDGQYYIATREGDRPEVMLAIPNPNGDEGDWLDESGGDGGGGGGGGGGGSCGGGSGDPYDLVARQQPSAQAQSRPAPNLTPPPGYQPLGRGAPPGAIVASPVPGASPAAVAAPPPGLGARPQRGYVPRRSAKFGGSAPRGSALTSGLDGVPDGLSFLGGFLVGFGQGGVDLVVGTIKLAVVIPLKSAQFQWALITHPFSTLKEAWRQAQVAGNFIYQAGTVIFYIQWYGNQFLARVILGDPDAIQTGSAILRAALQFSAELLSAAWQYAIALSPYDQGWYFGRSMFEIAALIAPYAQIGKITSIQKLAFLNDLRLSTKPLTLFRSPQAGRKLAELITLLERLLKLCHCFPAGTPVLTPSGVVPIEQIHVGDRVLSRDPVSGIQAPRPVLETTTTAHTQLFHVHYHLNAPAIGAEATWARTVAHRSRPRGDASGDDEPPEIVSTGTHPYWVEQRNAFVEAHALRAGDRLSLANGGTAEVDSVEREDAPTGQHFVTYNLSVEDFNTFFAGPDALWVHNYGLSCQTFLQLMENTRVDFISKGRTLTDFQLFQITFQRAFGKANPGRFGWVIDEVKDIIREAPAIFPKFQPESILYSEWQLKNGIWQWLKNEGIQGAHWWSVNDLGRGATVGGVAAEGAVIPLASAMHVPRPYGMHPLQHEFLELQFEAGTWTLAKEKFGQLALKDPELFRLQQDILRKSWKDLFNLDMPVFEFLEGQEALHFGRGVWRPGMK